MQTNKTIITSSIWYEQADEQSEFQPKSISCMGYDIVNQILPNATWIEYLFLLISGKRAEPQEKLLLEKLSLILCNPGLRDFGVRAAMNAGVGKAPASSILISGISCSAGQFYGSQEVSLCMQWMKASVKLSDAESSDGKTSDFEPLSFINALKKLDKKEVLPDIKHPPGFDIHFEKTSPFVLECLQFLTKAVSSSYLNGLEEHRETIESTAGYPISLICVLAAGFCDLGLTEEQCEYLFLILRLPGIAAHALEQKELGWKKFPFFADTVKFTQEEKPTKLPDISQLVKHYVND
ncbi:hypothetical protein [Aliikangiella maris]|uniref:Citrate synthase (unknown stereospecificity) n=2 Tax=Aliikangiella maris TaxID=3162458 RepID=A0ABV3MI23_9GAMM